MKRKIALFVCILLLCSGVGVMAYPAASNWATQQQNRSDIEEYQAAAEQLSEEEKQAQLAAAQAYNAQVAGSVVEDPFEGRNLAPMEYEDILNINGIIGYVHIPCIGLTLPIRHGTTDDILRDSVGHIEVTSFPIGGESTHSVLTAHNSMPNVKLFDELDQIEVGDWIYVYVLDMTLSYQVDGFVVVDPNDTEALRVREGKELITLVTCAPKNSTTYRLLFETERVEDPPEEAAPPPPEQAIAATGDTGVGIWVFAAAAAVALATLLLLVRSLVAGQRPRKQGRAYKKGRGR